MLKEHKRESEKKSLISAATNHCKLQVKFFYENSLESDSDSRSFNSMYLKVIFAPEATPPPPPR